MPVRAASQPTSLPASQPTVRASTSTHEHREHPSPRHRCCTLAHDVAAVSPRVSLSQKLGLQAIHVEHRCNELRTANADWKHHRLQSVWPQAHSDGYIVLHLLHSTIRLSRTWPSPLPHTPAPLVRHRHGCSSRPNAYH